MASNNYDSKVNDTQRVPFRLGERDIANRLLRSTSITAFENFTSQTRPESILSWKEKPRRCLIIKKINDHQCSNDLLKVGKYLKKLNIEPYVESIVKEKEFPQFESVDKNDPGKGIDLVITIGGDGTLLYLTSLFQTGQPVPPIVSFARGSLGFLTPFDFSEYKKILKKVTKLNQPHSICVRMRIVARIWRHPNNVTEKEKQAMIERKNRLKQKLQDQGSLLSQMEREILQVKTPHITSQHETVRSDATDTLLADNHIEQLCIDDDKQNNPNNTYNPPNPHNTQQTTQNTRPAKIQLHSGVNSNNSNNTTNTTNTTNINNNATTPNTNTNNNSNNYYNYTSYINTASAKSSHSELDLNGLVISPNSSNTELSGAAGAYGDENSTHTMAPNHAASRSLGSASQPLLLGSNSNPTIMSPQTSNNNSNNNHPSAINVQPTLHSIRENGSLRQNSLFNYDIGDPNGFNTVNTNNNNINNINSINSINTINTNPNNSSTRGGAAAVAGTRHTKSTSHPNVGMGHTPRFLGSPGTLRTPSVPIAGVSNPSVSSQLKSSTLERQASMIHIEDRVNVCQTQTLFKDHTLIDLEKHVLNEVLVHRDGVNGASMISTDLFMDGIRVTTINADGFIISTPSGSTAYSVSAGGSLISPTVPCIGVTPICPHTLSFRPVVVPDSTLIHVQVPLDARYDAVVSFDGKNPTKILKGDVVEIMVSEYPVPTFKSTTFQEEWFQSLLKHFHWNERQLQKAFTSRGAAAAASSIDPDSDESSDGNETDQSSNNGDVDSPVNDDEPYE